MSLSRCSSWPKLSLHYTEIDSVMHSGKTLYNLHVHVIEQLWAKRWNVHDLGPNYKTSYDNLRIWWWLM